MLLLGACGTEPIAAPPAPPVPTDPTGATAVRLEQTDDSTIAGALSLACSDTGGTMENSWYRVFPLRDFAIGGAFTVNRVNFGVQTAIGTQRVQVSIGTYKGSAGAELLDATKLDMLAMTSVVVPPTSHGEILQANFAAVEIAPGANLVVEVHSPAHGVDSSYFYLGATKGQETIPGYLRAPACNTPDPLMTSSLGYLRTHLIIAVSGSH